MVENNSNFFRCTNCLNASTRPRIKFDLDGICNACTWAKRKENLDWSLRARELQAVLNKHRSKSGQNDCIVPVSGGKDGSYVAYQLKHKYGMNPLTVTVNPALPLEIGNHNLDSFIESGFDNFRFSFNPKVLAKVNRTGFEEWGFPYFGWLLGIMTVPISLASSLGIDLIFYGEDGEVEYGGSSETENNPQYDIEYMQRVYFEGGQNPVLNKSGLDDKDLTWFKFQNNKAQEFSKLEILHWSYFENWDPYRNYLVAKQYCGLTEAKETNSGTFTNFAQNDQALYSLHAYLMYLKFGFGRATQDAGIEIRRGAMTREQGMNLVRIFDGKFPEEFIDLFLEYYQMSKNEFIATINRHTNKDLFEVSTEFPVPKIDLFQ